MASDASERPESVKKRPERGRKVWVEMYPGGDAMIEVGHIDNIDELYLQSDEVESLHEALDDLLNCTVDPDSNREVSEAGGDET